MVIHGEGCDYPRKRSTTRNVCATVTILSLLNFMHSSKPQAIIITHQETMHDDIMHEAVMKIRECTKNSVKFNLLQQGFPS